MKKGDKTTMAAIITFRIQNSNGDKDFYLKILVEKLGHITVSEVGWCTSATSVTLFSFKISPQGV